MSNHAETLRRMPDRLHLSAKDAAACLAGAEAWENAKWRPIETAPKDGTRILLYARATGAEIGAWDENSDQWLSEQNYTRYPSHWLHLPPKPEKEN